jgi:predicted nucleic acid-binding protein
MICAVCDTGPLLHLSEAHALDALRHVDEIHAPPLVIAEMNYHLADWETPPWVTIDALDAAHVAEAAAWLQAELLHAGEADAIALARQIDADWLLTDDAAARLFASELGLEVHGSLGVILWAAAVGHMDRPIAEQALTQLAAPSLWLSSRILGEAWAALVEIYRIDS